MGGCGAGCRFDLPPLAASQFFSVVLIIFIAEVAAAVVVLVYTSLVSGLVGCWAGIFWDPSNPFRKTGGPGGAACGLGGQDTKLVLCGTAWPGGGAARGAGNKAEIPLPQRNEHCHTGLAHRLLLNTLVRNQPRLDTSGGSSHAGEAVPREPKRLLYTRELPWGGRPRHRLVGGRRSQPQGRRHSWPPRPGCLSTESLPTAASGPKRRGW